MSEKAPDEFAEIARCKRSPIYFTNNYCKIKAGDSGEWVPFKLWREQNEVLRLFVAEKQVIVLKARQVGLTWLALCYALWLMIFKPGVTVLLFSLRDDEAMDLLSRLKGIYKRLPSFLQYPGTKEGSKHDWELPNGSKAMAFPTGTGDSYTGALAIVDEADLIGKELADTINSVKPAIDAGGQLFLISKSNKKLPSSPFKNIYRAARNGEVSSWKCAFLPWYCRPGRTRQWYDSERLSQFKVTGSNDYMAENYPNTDLEALAPSEEDKRIPSDWLNACYHEMRPIDPPAQIRNIIKLNVYREVVPYRTYVIGADPAEGNPNSDDSALVVIDQLSGEEVASFAGKAPPRRLAEIAYAVAKYYNNAAVMVERNNHGHAFILWWEDNGQNVPLLNGYDEKKGWLNNRKGKCFIYDHAADQFHDQAVKIHTRKALEQLQLIEANTLLAPEGHKDDLSDAFVLAMKAAEVSTYGLGRTPKDWKIDFDSSMPFGLGQPGSSRPFGLSAQSGSRPFGM